MAGGAGLAGFAGFATFTDRRGLLAALTGGRLRSVDRTAVLMGTGVRLTLVGDDLEAAEAAADATLGRMAALEATLSRHRPDSQLSRLNAGGALDAAAPELLDVLRRAARLSDLGGGAFDVTVQPLLDLWRAQRTAPAPARIEETLERVDHRSVRIAGSRVELLRSGTRVTLDGIGKGYIVDRGVDELRARGFGRVLVDAGGDLVACGGRGDLTGADEAWRIGIRRPRPGLALQTMQARFDAYDCAVATSGDYMQPFTPDYRQHHILDPRTGYSAPALASSTVLAPDAATADGLATLTMALDLAGAVDVIESLPGCEAYFVTKNLDVRRTSGFRLA